MCGCGDVFYKMMVEKDNEQKSIEAAKKGPKKPKPKPNVTKPKPY